MSHNGLIGANDFKFEQGEKLDHYLRQNFAANYSLNALKRCLDPEMSRKDLIWAKNLKF